jgi:hypothetical protein
MFKYLEEEYRIMDFISEIESTVLILLIVLLILNGIQGLQIDRVQKDLKSIKEKLEID